METSQPTTAGGAAKGPLVERIINRIFRCSHRHKGLPITLKGETFAVCLDCGNHVPYNFHPLRVGTGRRSNQAAPDALQPAKKVERSIPAAKSIPAPKSVPAGKSVTAPKSVPGARPIPPVKSIPAAKPKSVVPDKGNKINVPNPIHGFRTRIGGGFLLGLLAIGLGGGIYYSNNRLPAPADHVAPDPVQPSTVPQSVPRTAASHTPPAPIPDTAATSRPAANTRSAANSRPASEVRSSNQIVRLEGEGRYVVVAREASAALEISQYPGRLGSLIQSGSLFTVSRGTAIQVLQSNKNIVQVLLKDGPLAGQAGWVQTSKVTP